MKTISISVEGITLKAELNDSITAREILNSLPLEGSANVWGNEIYFEIPVVISREEEAREEVEVGELGYWHVGNAFCIFFGPTPVSTDERPRAASPVNVFGRVSGDATQLRSVKNGSTVRVELSETNII